MKAIYPVCGITETGFFNRIETISTMKTLRNKEIPRLYAHFFLPLDGLITK